MCDWIYSGEKGSVDAEYCGVTHSTLGFAVTYALLHLQKFRRIVPL